MYVNPWLFNGKEFETEDIGPYQAFVYRITTPDGRFYIGRKTFWNLKRVKDKKRRVRVESDWKKYYGSSVNLKEEVKQNGPEGYKREIMSLHLTQGDANRCEEELQVKLNVLYHTKSLNEQIGGKITVSRKIVNGRKISDEASGHILKDFI